MTTPAVKITSERVPGFGRAESVGRSITGCKGMRVGVNLNNMF